MQHAKAWAVLLWLASAAVILAVLVMQYGFGQAPCHLCLYERVPYYALLVLLPLALLAGRPRRGLAAGLLLLAGGAVLSGYHAGVEQGLFDLPTSCVAGGEASSIEDLRNQLMAARPTCDQVSLSFLGLSLATWNALLSLSLSLVTLLVLLRARSGAQQERQRRVA